MYLWIPYGAHPSKPFYQTFLYGTYTSSHPTFGIFLGSAYSVFLLVYLRKTHLKGESVSVFLFITIRFLLIKITFFSPFFNSICRWSKTNNLRSFPNFKTIINKIIPDTNQILSSNDEFNYVLHDEMNQKLPGQTTQNTPVQLPDKYYPPNVIRLSKIICAFITESKYTAIFYFYMLSIFYFNLFSLLFLNHATSEKGDTKNLPSFAIVSPNFHR